MHIVERDFMGRTLSFETGRIAKQANGSVLVRQGDTMVLVTACMGDERDIDFFPLTVDYVEKTYAGGRIPGGFFKREGRLSEGETLTSRFIDRPIRPLFPDGMRREVQIIATVISADSENDPDMLALCGASAALTVSDIPFAGPIAAVRVARIDGKLLCNPTYDQAEEADLNFIVAGSRDAIVMVEGGAKEVPDNEVVDALFYAQEQLQVILDMQDELQRKAGRPKVEMTPPQIDTELLDKMRTAVADKMRSASVILDKIERKTALKALKEELLAQFVDAQAEDADAQTKKVKGLFEELHSEVVRNMILSEKKRIDGRDPYTVRPISIEAGILPRAHGSALFTRGETQAIVSCTLGTAIEAQRIDSLLGEEKKTFMLHYNFPPFSVGETRPMRGPGRREVGHGALAERAVKNMLSEESGSDYVIRIVSEITESNGSSSMASVCGASLALMDAGIKLKAPVAGVAMGLIEGKDNFVVLTDILGDEDHLGDMDFKVCGSERGVTALQMDIKIQGLSKEVVVQAMEQARAGRLHILGEMNKVISEARTEMSPFAPRVVKLKIKTDKIRDIIGPGGKVIKGLSEEFEVKIDVTDDGWVSVFGTDELKTAKAVRRIEQIVEEAEIGKIYTGEVMKITDFGAFVEILPGTQGLLHISQIDDRRIESVSDVLREGDEVMVKVLEIDRQGKIRLSRKEALADIKAQA